MILHKPGIGELYFSSASSANSHAHDLHWARGEGVGGEPHRSVDPEQIGAVRKKVIPSCHAMTSSRMMG